MATVNISKSFSKGPAVERVERVQYVYAKRKAVEHLTEDERDIHVTIERVGA